MARRSVWFLPWVVSAGAFAPASPAAGEGASIARGPEVLPLEGEWTVKLDPADEGIGAKWYAATFTDRIRLPGSLAEGGYGDAISVDTPWTGSIVDRSWFTDPKYAPYRRPGNVKVPFWLQPVKHYLGRAWFQRTVRIPRVWTGKRIVLLLERCHWETRVWVDDAPAGMRNSLSVPHEYDLTDRLAPGAHRLTICVDNRLKINVGRNAHSVSDHTQTNWNGIIGAMALRATDPVWIEAIRVDPDVASRTARVRVTLGSRLDRPARGVLDLRARSFNAPRRHAPPPKSTRIAIPAGESAVDVAYPMGEDVLLWDEFAPALYELAAEIRTEPEGYVDRRTTTFGMRAFRAEGTRFTVNGRKIFLRGTLECCVFPLTGHPPMDVEPWLENLRVARAHGLNHIRFHSWCPPEAAFEAADRLGVYFHVEGPAWTAVGDGKPVDAYLRAEYDRILEFYGNHPSFCMLAYGNEPGGRHQREYLAALLEEWKAKDPRRLYTSAAGWPIIPENDYHVTPAPRIHQWGGGLRCRLNARPPETVTDYRDFIGKYEVPVVSHEIGQWCVYPNFDEIPKYTGVLRARNFEIFRDTLGANHMGDRAHDFLIASGKLQALCYKEEIESALRTPGMGGFQLLDLHDFPGQGTALVGVLDPFWGSKGYITAEAFRRFCGPTVPLARMRKRVWTQDETFAASVEIAHFGPAPIEKASPVWRITGGRGEAVASGTLPRRRIPIGNGIPLGRIEVPLSVACAPAGLRLEVALAGTPFANDWDFWVYPEAVETAVPEGIRLADALDGETLAALEAGGKVLLVPGPGRVKGDARGKVALGFSPIFWNTAWTRRQAPHTLGILCDPGHPALARFPTDFHTNWQWWELIHTAQCMVLDGLPPNLRPIVAVIDDWFTNRRLGLLFEARVGRGKLVVCGMDLRGDLGRRPVARQMRHSLLAYMRSEAFAPPVEIAPARIRALFTEPPVIGRLGGRIIHADSEAPGYEARNAIDGDPSTCWHTAWEPRAPAFPHEIRIALREPIRIAGFRYLPRQDMANGRIAAYAFHVSADGREWGPPAAQGTFPDGAAERTVRLRAPVEGRFVRFVALSEVHGHAFASMAEFDLIPGE